MNDRAVFFPVLYACIWTFYCALGYPLLFVYWKNLFMWVFNLPKTCIILLSYWFIYTCIISFGKWWMSISLSQYTGRFWLLLFNYQIDIADKSMNLFSYIETWEQKWNKIYGALIQLIPVFLSETDIHDVFSQKLGCYAVFICA